MMPEQSCAASLVLAARADGPVPRTLQREELTTQARCQSVVAAGQGEDSGHELTFVCWAWLSHSLLYEGLCLGIGSILDLGSKDVRVASGLLEQG